MIVLTFLFVYVHDTNRQYYIFITNFSRGGKKKVVI